MLEAAEPGSMLMLVDGDTFEEKNIDRQDFQDFGYKTVVRANELQPKYVNTLIVPQAYWVVKHTEEWPEEEGSMVGANLLLEDGDIVFATVDNHATRKILFEAAMKLDNVDVFTGGNDEEYFGSTFHYQRRDGEDTIDSPFENHPEMAQPGDKNPGEMSCEERAELASGTQLLATNMTVSALLLGRFHKTVIKGDVDESAEIYFDLGIGKAVPYDRRPVSEVDVTTEVVIEVIITEEENING